MTAAHQPWHNSVWFKRWLTIARGLALLALCVSAQASQIVDFGIHRIGTLSNSFAHIDGTDTRVDVDIAIIDTGIQLTHPDLNVYTNVTFVPATLNGNDDAGHGTFVAGVAAALDNTIGTVGVAPGARLWAVKCFDNTGNGPSSQAIAALNWVAAHADQIEVCNCSFGYSGPGSWDPVGPGNAALMRAAVQACVNAGVVVVVSAGDTNEDIYGPDHIWNTADDIVPVSFPEVIGVSTFGDFDGMPGGLSATEQDGHDDTLSNSSSYSTTLASPFPVAAPGGAIGFAAPGSSVYSCWTNSSYVTGSGSSAAAPFVSGAVALYIAQYGRATNAEGVYRIRQAVLNAAEPMVAWGQYPPNPHPTDHYPEGLINVRDWGSRTFYIDFVGGNDANDGRSPAYAWQKCPGMAGFGVVYIHQAGDRFVFKGGVTWPVTCFPMAVVAGGSSDTVRDYYGTDTNWFTGATFARPLFDFQDTQLSANGFSAGAGIHVIASNITFDDLEMARHRAPLSTGGNSSFGCVTLLLDGTPNNITVTNCLIRDWSIPTPVIAGTDGAGGGGIHFINSGGGTGFLITHCTFHQAGSAVKSGASCNLFGTYEYNEFYSTPNGVIGGGTIRYNHIHDITDATDPNTHPNAMESFSPTTTYANLIHGMSANAAAIYHVPDWSGGSGVDLIYNNVVYDCGNQAAVQIDTGGAHTATIGARIYNNTLVHLSQTIRVVERGTGPYGTLDVRNNLLITSGLPVACCNPGAGNANIINYTFSSNVVYTASVAAGFGFTSANYYAPTLSFGAYRNSGVDFSAIFTTDRLGVTRTVPWDIGAYEFVGLTPPSTVKIAINELRAGVITTRGP